MVPWGLLAATFFNMGRDWIHRNAKKKKIQNVLRRLPECGWSRDQIQQFQASKDEYQTILGFPPSSHEISTFTQNQFVIWKFLMLLTNSDPAPNFLSTLLIISNYVQYYGYSLDASIISPSFSMYFSEPLWLWKNNLMYTRWRDGIHLVSYGAYWSN